MAIKQSLRALGIQLSQLDRCISAHLDLKGFDLDCLDIIALYGPLSPSALSRQAGLHPATITGILDRLERGRWVARDRDPSDRRAVVVRVLSDRSTELKRFFSGMNTSMDQILAGYGDAELELVADFLRRAVDAGQRAADQLGGRLERREAE